jgi:D-alanine-D-alanine ligase
MARVSPDVVFNRVESLGGSDAMMAAIPLLLDTMQIPYTGCSGEALAATASKISVKQRLVFGNLPTPAWITSDGIRHGDANPRSAIADSNFIIKSIYEHSSFQLNDASIIRGAKPKQIAQILQQREAESGRPFFAEQFIDGREFNLSVLGSEPQVLPPAEIDFSDFPDGKPHIVCHGAKCDATSFEYHHTPRRFDFPPSDATLIDRLETLAAECSRLFSLNGYARIDFRCDADGQPWILEINSNPCLSPNSGFPAALARIGYSYEEGIQRLLDDALRRGSLPAGPRPRSNPRRSMVVPGLGIS